MPMSVVRFAKWIENSQNSFENTTPINTLNLMPYIFYAMLSIKRNLLEKMSFIVSFVSHSNEIPKFIRK